MKERMNEREREREGKREREVESMCLSHPFTDRLLFLQGFDFSFAIHKY